jgi:hypothetical protein
MNTMLYFMDDSEHRKAEKRLISGAIMRLLCLNCVMFARTNAGLTPLAGDATFRALQGIGSRTTQEASSGQAKPAKDFTVNVNLTVIDKAQAGHCTRVWAARG